MTCTCVTSSSSDWRWRRTSPTLWMRRPTSSWLWGRGWSCFSSSATSGWMPMTSLTFWRCVSLTSGVFFFFKTKTLWCLMRIMMWNWAFLFSGQVCHSMKWCYHACLQCCISTCLSPYLLLCFDAGVVVQVISYIIPKLQIFQFPAQRPHLSWGDMVLPVCVWDCLERTPGGVVWLWWRSGGGEEYE